MRRYIVRFDDGTEKSLQGSNLRRGAFDARFAVGERVILFGSYGRVSRIDYVAERYG